MALRKLGGSPFDSDFDDTALNGNRKGYKEPETWTIINALDCILSQARGSELSDEFWNTCKKPLEFLRGQLELTDMQIVVLAILIEAGEPLSWRRLGNYLNCSRLSMMVYSDEIEDLVRKRWVVRKGDRVVGGGFFEGFALVHGVITALRHNKVFVPEKIDGLEEQDFVDRLESHIDKNLHDRTLAFKDDEEWMLQLAAANPHLPLCHEVLALDDIHAQSLLLMIVFDYAQWADSEHEGLLLNSIDELYPEDFMCNNLRRKLRNGSHILICKGLIEHKCEDGVADADRYMLTKKTKEELLSAYTPSRSRCRNIKRNDRRLKSFAQIKEKTLFFNDNVKEQIDRLTSLLSVENLPSVQERLEEQGMRKGFACLFYGTPGTGKTESVLQIARQTGRDIMQVDIAGLRDKWVGESEKNIKAVFSNYRDLCKRAEVMPILLFNEADAIFTKRNKNAERSVEKMDNAMQNIILQEIEDLDGILIATTNLTTNLDPAFERRFLFKVEFHKPDADVKTLIWQSMIKELSIEDARTLASKYDFSGGQIENIARKRTIDYILSGKVATLVELEKYCQNELLDNKKERKQIAGFSV